jgi:hypothetical protein
MTRQAMGSRDAPYGSQYRLEFSLNRQSSLPRDHCKAFIGCSGAHRGSCPVVCGHGLAIDRIDVSKTLGQR